MKMKKVCIFINCVFLLAGIGSLAYAQASFVDMPSAVSISQVLTLPAKYDQTVVTLSGEVIGEPLRSGEGAWVNLIAQGVPLGIFVPDFAMLEPITYWGEYGVQGDIIVVTGTFFSACAQHQERDLHAQTIRVLNVGSVWKETVSPFKKKAAVILCIICLTLALLYFIKVKVYGKPH